MLYKMSSVRTDHDALSAILKLRFFGCNEKPTEHERRQCVETARKSYDAWNSVKTFDDLKMVFKNVALGKLYSPGYGDLLSESVDVDNAYMHRFTDKFAELNDIGFLTTDSQFEEHGDDGNIQKAYITGFMSNNMAERVCDMVNMRDDMVAYARKIYQLDYPMIEKTRFGVTFEDGVRTTSMNLMANPQLDYQEWCPRINDIIRNTHADDVDADEESLVFVTLIHVNTRAKMGTLLEFAIKCVRACNK